MEPTKSSRRFHQKVKSGCLTCRVRRIKCDEKKPVCFRCRSTKRVCDGYAAAWNDSTIPPARDRAISPSCAIVTGLGGHSERRSLQFYLERTSPHLYGHFDLDLWRILVPRVSQDSGPAQNALIALAALHESHQAAAVRGRSVYALKHYSRAIRAIQEQACPTDQPEGLLVAFALLLAFELLMDNDAAALALLETATKFIQAWRCSALNPRTSLTADADQDALVSLFVRYEVQAAIFTGWRVPHLVVRWDSNFASSPSPDLVVLRKRLYHQLSQVNNFFCTTCSTADADGFAHVGDQPIWVFAQQQALLTALDEWSAAMAALLRQTSFCLSQTELQLARSLQIQHLVTRIRLACCVHHEETMFDAYEADFNRAVTLAAAYIDVVCNAGKPEDCSSFSIEMGVLHALWFTACKCRDPVLRRRALPLLSAAPREGVWDGKVLGRVAERVVALEERLEASALHETGMSPAAADIPEWARIHAIHMPPNRAARCVTAGFTRRPNGMDGEWQEIKETLTW